jgi:autotransporter-associated beta strand protein
VAGALSVIDISGAGTLTLGTSGIDLSAALATNLTISSGLTLLGQQSWKAAAAKTLDVAGTFTRTGAYVDFNNFNASAVLATLVNNNNILGAWAYTGSGTTLKYVQSVSSLLSAYTNATADAGNLASVTSATDNYKYAAAATLGANRTGNTLQYTGAATTTALGTNSLTLNGLMNSGTGKLTITGTAGNPGLVAGAGGELDIISNTQAIDISSVISGTGTLVYGGPNAGTLTLSGVNTYSGGTTINAGTVALASQVNTAIGTGPITVNSGGKLLLARHQIARDLTLNGGTFAVSSGNYDPTFSGTISLVANSIFDISNGNEEYASIYATISGVGGLTKTGFGTFKFNSAANNYDGPTVVSAGTLQVQSSLYGNDTAKWTPANITVASNAMLRVNIGGGSDFTPAQVATLFSSLTPVNNNGLKAGSIFVFDTVNAPSTVIFSGVLTDSTGPGGGVVNVKIGGPKTLSLSNTNSTYTGKTIILPLTGSGGNGNLSVASFNSVATDVGLGTVHSASSCMGAPITVANGTIDIGYASLQGGSTLIYTGQGETTDRVINSIGNASSPVTIEQAGSGLLKFTSAFTRAAASAITLQGSTDGKGEIVSGLPAFGALNKSGTGMWTLSGANLYTGVTTVNAGSLVLNHATALPGGIGASGGLSALTFNGGVIGLGIGDFTRSLAAAGIVTGVNFTGAGGWAAYGADRLVNLGGASTPITWATASTGFNGKILILGNATATHTVDFQNPLVLGTASCTVQVDDGAAAVDGKLSGILSGSAGGTLTKNGLGTLALTGANTYPAATIVNAGTLLVHGNNSGTGAVTVNAGASLGGTGTVAAAVTAAAGGAINLRDGAVGTLSLGALTLSGSATSPNSLLFDLGNAANGTDKIVLSGAHTANTANGALVSLNQLPGTAINPGTYTLIQGGVGTGNNFTGYTLATARAGRNVYSAFGASGSNLVVTVGTGNAGDSIGNVYWKGNTAFWNTAQWYADASESTQTNLPGYSSNVRFATVSPVTLSTTLGQDFEINSLTVDAGFAPIAINGNMLTLDATSDNSNTLGNGITIGNAAVVTIASKVGLAASQTWTVGPGASLTNSGVVSDFGGGYSLAKAGAGTLTLTGVNTFGGALTISDGMLTIGGAGQLNSGTYVVNILNNGIFNYSSSANQTLSGLISGTGALVKGGVSTLTLSGASTYSGGTTINAGTVSLASGVPGAIGTGPITINSGGTLRLARTSLNRALTLNGGTLYGPGDTETVSGTIALTANSTLDYPQVNFGTGLITSSISGAGGLTKTGTGLLRFTNAGNTYTGPTVISANGGIAVTQSLYGNDTSKWIPANITVATNAVLGMHVGGPGEFTMGQVATMFGNLTTSVNNNGLRPGAIPTIYTLNAPAGTYTYSAVLADSTGTGGGAVNFKLFGTANTTLELTAANTYSGVTLIDNNGTLKVSSFNSVNGGNPPMASSSLGRPTTVANGTIWLGVGSWDGNNKLDTTYNSGNLTYTGTGETTDRVLQLAGYTGGSGVRNYTLDQSGTGLLKFTSDLSGGGNTTHSIILTGSTTGTGEIAGAIPLLGGPAGNTTITKSGTGTWTLSGTNRYTGTTTVSQGTLLITGSISNGAVTVASGATLGGGGIIGSNVTYASGAKALFTPGQTLKILGSLTLNSNVVYLNLPTNFSGGTFTLATYNTTGSSGTFATVPVAVNGTLSPQATITTANGTVILYVPPKGTVINIL